MSKYPKEITDEMLDELAYVSDEEIALTIADIEVEIATTEKEIQRALFIARVKKIFLRDRQDLIDSLKKIQTARQTAVTQEDIA